MAKKSKINGFLTFFFQMEKPQKEASIAKNFFSKNYDFLGFFK